MCLTPGSAHEPWVNYEAGSIAKFVEQSHVSPLLFGVAQEELAGLPLSMFQCTEFRKDEMHKLLGSINVAAGSLIPVESLAEILESSWTDLAKQVDRIDLAGGQPSEVEGGDHANNDHAVLNEVEERILALVAAMDNDHPWAEHIAAQIGEDQIRTQYHLDRLVAGEYMFELLNTMQPASYGVTAQGRAYLVRERVGLSSSDDSWFTRSAAPSALSIRHRARQDGTHGVYVRPIGNHEGSQRLLERRAARLIP